MKIQNKNSGYSILVVLMIIGFLMVLTIGVLNLVLRELKDNRGVGNYLKIYAGAEAAQELALLQIKKHGYGIYDKKEDLEYLKTRKDKIKINYDLNSKTKSYSGSLEPFKQAVIPLFYIKQDYNIDKIEDLKLNIINYSNFPSNNNMAWNIISQNGDGIGGVGNIGILKKAKGRKSDGSFLGGINISGNDGFLNTYEGNYLIIINLDPFNTLDFSINSNGYFTKPVSKILSSAEIGNYKQNLETTLDNTAFLSILKYSVFSK